MLLVNQISACNNLLECEDFLIKFAQKSNSVVWLEDEDGNIVYPKETDAEIISGDIVTPSDENNTTDAVPAGEKSTNYYPVILKNGDVYTLAVQADLLIVKQTT